MTPQASANLDDRAAWHSHLPANQADRRAILPHP
jgi:hypothetical protein